MRRPKFRRSAGGNHPASYRRQSDDIAAVRPAISPSSDGVTDARDLATVARDIKRVIDDRARRELVAARKRSRKR